MNWDEFPEAGRGLWRAIRTDGVGESMFLDDSFVQDGLRAISDQLDPADLKVYQRPYPTRESRLPLLRWARSMPLDGTPSDVVARVEAYDEWLASSQDVPKLMVTFTPAYGTMTEPAVIDWCAKTISALHIQRCDEIAGHHTPEDQPDVLAAAISDWLDRNSLR
ncbi:hypothetical protein [Nocardia sp. R6R-6]|uniref:hypothetical protein n=1 Tax=Nocardia sp. R6R-6 TaxID=3459303 RepID=UPI00403DC52F